METVLDLSFCNQDRWHLLGISRPGIDPCAPSLLNSPYPHLPGNFVMHVTNLQLSHNSTGAISAHFESSVKLVRLLFTLSYLSYEKVGSFAARVDRRHCQRHRSASSAKRQVRSIHLNRRISPLRRLRCPSTANNDLSPWTSSLGDQLNARDDQNSDLSRRQRRAVFRTDPRREC